MAMSCHPSRTSVCLALAVAICVFLPGCFSSKIALEIFERACHCFDDHNVYNECAAELRMGVEGAFHVGRESVDEYCGGACFAETELALRCVEEIAHDGFRFSNGASLFAVKQALGTGCSYTPERGTFDIRERRECGDEYGYGYHGTHEQLGYGEEGDDRQYEYPDGAFGNYCSGATGGGPVRMLLLASFLASASVALLLAV
ncbi:uncharacterized protein LOC123440879 [Hordeum vulgare subsp. vulgare]|uniref:DUF7731 domain-containing protein n=1 Tax=Hordeum vulgare subsp. vulgare TaxID=112509 RepID=A0A8I6WQT4_HORVV|nr:uncharacterized protein LOC123440879 [Hordeum vulgare subsp. vulgare]